jgi:hypothetical protein
MAALTITISEISTRGIEIMGVALWTIITIRIISEGNLLTVIAIEAYGKTKGALMMIGWGGTIMEPKKNSSLTRRIDTPVGTIFPWSMATVDADGRILEGGRGQITPMIRGMIITRETNMMKMSLQGKICRIII